MSRSGYSDECDGWALIRWRGAVASALRGKRGQATLVKVGLDPYEWDMKREACQNILDQLTRRAT